MIAPSMHVFGDDGKCELCGRNLRDPGAAMTTCPEPKKVIDATDNKQ